VKQNVIICLTVVGVFYSSFHVSLTVWLGDDTGAAALPRLGEGVVSGDHM